MGPADGIEGWFNSSTKARYLNKRAPDANGSTTVAVVIEGKLFRVKAKSTGDIPFEGKALYGHDLYTMFNVSNGATGNRFCTRFDFHDCAFKDIGGTATKIVCKTGVGDPACTAQTALQPLQCSAAGSTACQSCLRPGLTCTARCALNGSCCDSAACEECTLWAICDSPFSELLNCFDECGCGRG